MSRLIFITGATGYVGSCLIPRLLEKGYQVRVLVRDPKRLIGRAWLDQVEVFRGSLFDVPVLEHAFINVSAAIYLVHNMSSGWNYEARGLESARNFLSAGEAANIEQIVYLGGLADPREEIGPHLRSRLQTGEILRSGRIPVTEFRASLIIGSGSISFEMIRYLTEQTPIIIGPVNLRNLTQPIAIRNVLEYLIAALEIPSSRGHVYEIGGGSVLSYAETLRTYAHLRGLSRPILLLPGIPDSLMALIIGKLTPVPSRIARPLIGGMRVHSIVSNDSALKAFPQIKLLNYQDSVLLALDNLQPNRLESVWLNNASLSRIKQQGFFVENRRIQIKARPEDVYQVIIGLGGNRGWIYLNWLWKLRGTIDRLIGGPGMRGRDFVGIPSIGDVIDFYRVESLTPARLFRLSAELKVPGLGWMEWRTDPDGEETRTLLTQTAFFAPKGFWGFLYWYLLWPEHNLVFSGLIRSIARCAMQIDKSKGGDHDHQL